MGYNSKTYAPSKLGDDTRNRGQAGFCTTTPAHSSKTRIAEQKSSSPHPRAIVARNICSVNAVAGIGTSIALADSSARPTSLCIHLVAKLVRKSRASTYGALKE